MSKAKALNIETFNSISAFMNAISSRENNDNMKRDHSSQRNDYSFFGTKDYEEATRLITNGWEEKLSEIKKQFTSSIKQNSNGTINKRRTYNHVVGYAPNVPNAILGLPQSMINSQTEAQKVKVVSLIYSPTANCGTDIDTFIKAGIVILNIVHQLELNGIRVNLQIAAKDSMDYGNNFSAVFVTIKNYREALDIKKVAFPIAHPSMLRRFGFKWLETFPNLQGDFSGGYGHTVSDEKGHKEFLTEIGVLRPTDYFISLGQIEQLRFDTQKVIENIGIEF